MQQRRKILLAALLLGGFAVVGVLLVASVHKLTAERIIANQREYLLRQLHQVIHPDQHDNVLFRDTIQVTDPDLLGTREPVTVFRARRQGQPVAAVLTPVAPDGYSGSIHLMVAIAYDGRILGVRATQHLETPGLGDAVDADKSDWVLSFNGRRLGDPPDKQWKVKRDGGVFDQFTGATITPRAVVKAVHKALLYFKAHRDELFAPATQPPQATP